MSARTEFFDRCFPRREWGTTVPMPTSFSLQAAYFSKSDSLIIHEGRDGEEKERDWSENWGGFFLKAVASWIFFSTSSAIFRPALPFACQNTSVQYLCKDFFIKPGKRPWPKFGSNIYNFFRVFCCTNIWRECFFALHRLRRSLELKPHFPDFLSALGVNSSNGLFSITNGASFMSQAPISEQLVTPTQRNWIKNACSFGIMLDICVSEETLITLSPDKSHIQL